MCATLYHGSAPQHKHATLGTSSLTIAGATGMKSVRNCNHFDAKPCGAANLIRWANATPHSSSHKEVRPCGVVWSLWLQVWASRNSTPSSLLRSPSSNCSFPCSSTAYSTTHPSLRQHQSHTVRPSSRLLHLNLYLPIHTTPHHTTPHHTTPHHTTPHHSTVQYSTVQYSTVQYSTAQHSTAQHSRAGQGRAGQGRAGQSMESKDKNSKQKESNANHQTTKTTKHFFF